MLWPVSIERLSFHIYSFACSFNSHLDWVLARWTISENQKGEMWHYGVTVAALLFISVARSIIHSHFTLVASNNLVRQAIEVSYRHETIYFANDKTQKVLKTPMSWLDQTPVSTIINKFTTDQDILDNMLSYNLLETGHWTLAVIATLAFVSTQLIYFLIPVVPLIIVFWFVLVRIACC